MDYADPSIVEVPAQRLDVFFNYAIGAHAGEEALLILMALGMLLGYMIYSAVDAKRQRNRWRR